MLNTIYRCNKTVRSFYPLTITVTVGKPVLNSHRPRYSPIHISYIVWFYSLRGSNNVREKKYSIITCINRRLSTTVYPPNLIKRIEMILKEIIRAFETEETYTGTWSCFCYGYFNNRIRDINTNTLLNTLH